MMPGDHDAAAGAGTDETASLLGRSQRGVKRFFDGFVDFAFQGNILQIAFWPHVRSLPFGVFAVGCVADSKL